MLLDTTTKSLELKLGAAPSASQATYNIWVADHTTTTLTPAASDGATNGTTAVTAIPAPGANTQRQVKFLSVRNNDSASINVIVQLNNNSTIRTITSASISASNTLCYSDNTGFYVLDGNGTIQTSGGGGGGAGDVSTDAIWDAAGDLIQGTGANAAAKLAIGIATRGLRVNAAATAVEWAAGNTVQVVNTQTGVLATGTTNMPFDDTIPQNTEGNEYMTLAITPVDADNILHIDVIAVLANSISTAWLTGALFQDLTAGALAATSSFVGSANEITHVVFRHRMVAGTISATTFKLRAGGNAGGTTTFNGRSGAGLFGGVMASSITITEFSV